MCAYVITSWHASNEPVDGLLVAISGRNEGFVSWLLTRLEISPTVGDEEKQRSHGRARRAKSAGG